MYKKINFFHHIILLVYAKKQIITSTMNILKLEMDPNLNQIQRMQLLLTDGVGDSADAALDSPPDLSEYIAQ